MKKIIIFAIVIACIIFCASCIKNNTDTTVVNPDTGDIQEIVPPNEEDEVEEPAKADIILYYSDNQGLGLTKETRTVDAKDASDPAFVLKELIKGTENPNCVNVIPTNTAINACTVSGDRCTVDLGVDFIEIQGTASQEMAMYSVVNTLCAIDGITEVQFLIEGEKVSLFGNYDFASAFEADMSFVRN